MLCLFGTRRWKTPETPSIEPSRGKCVIEGFLSAFRPDFGVLDRYGGQMGWAKKTRRESCTWLGSNKG
jgi:hypothetical protein